MIFTQALLFALQMDTMLSFSEDPLPHLAFSLPCPWSRSRTEAAMVVLGKEGTPCVCHPSGLSGCGQGKCKGSSPSSKTHSPILQVEKQRDTVKRSGQAAWLQ